MGCVQVPKLDDFVAARRANHTAWCEAINGLGLPLRVYPELPGTTHAAFAFPMLLNEDSPSIAPRSAPSSRRWGSPRARFPALI